MKISFQKYRTAQCIKKGDVYFSNLLKVCIWLPLLMKFISSFWKKQVNLTVIDADTTETSQALLDQ